MQQTPSDEKPVAQEVPTADACPFFSSQVADALQVIVVPQLACGSVSANTGLQTPATPPEAWRLGAHALHAPHVAVVQQTPSVQLPVEHSRQPAVFLQSAPAAVARGRLSLLRLARPVHRAVVSRQAVLSDAQAVAGHVVLVPLQAKPAMHAGLPTAPGLGGAAGPVARAGVAWRAAAHT